MSKVSLDDQIAAMEITIANERGTIANLRELVRRKQREPIWLEIMEDRHPKMIAVLNTLKWLKKNEKAVKDALKA
jgi:hypothetical protein